MFSNCSFTGDESRYGVNGYRFELANWTYNREGDQDCFAGQPRLPDGLADASPCYWGKFIFEIRLIDGHSQIVSFDAKRILEKVFHIL